MERLKAIMSGVDFIPFVLATGSQVHLSIARIVEALIIATVTGGVVLYGANMVLSTKVDQIVKAYDQDRADTMQWRSYMQAELDKNRERIFVLSNAPKK